MSYAVTKEGYNTYLIKTGKAPIVDGGSATPKPSKYRNKIVVVDGLKFDSGIECRRWFYLAELERQGRISALRRQVDIPIYVNGIEVCFWRADHVYIEEGVEVWEDVKGKATDLYLLKKKLVEATYGKKIKEIRKA